MDNNKYGIRTNEDIEPALQMIRDKVCERLETGADRNICLLVCEELLIHLLMNDSSDIIVEAVTGRRACVKIYATGEPDELFDHSREVRRDDLQYSISRNILRRYDRQIEYKHSNNRNSYRISPRNDKNGSLQGEILAYYDRM
ncbi:MAG: hypothetical protein IJ873_08620, partial [Lachnospiraceae bacterium]|nr:hypothetical protein [Lachnospiraceae bacterium]